MTRIAPYMTINLPFQGSRPQMSGAYDRRLTATYAIVCSFQLSQIHKAIIDSTLGERLALRPRGSHRRGFCICRPDGHPRLSKSMRTAKSHQLPPWMSM